MESLVSRIEEHSPEIIAQYRAKLEEKMKDLLAYILRKAVLRRSYFVRR